MRQADDLVAEVKVYGRRSRVLEEQLSQALDAVIVQRINREHDLQRLPPVKVELGALEVRANKFGDLVAQIEPPLHAHDGVVGQEVAGFAHGARENEDLNR